MTLKYRLFFSSQIFLLYNVRNLSSDNYRIFFLPRPTNIIFFIYRKGLVSLSHQMIFFFLRSVDDVLSSILTNAECLPCASSLILILPSAYVHLSRASAEVTFISSSFPPSTIDKGPTQISFIRACAGQRTRKSRNLSQKRKEKKQYP